MESQIISILKDKKIETFYCFSGNYEIKKECFYHSNQ